MSVRMGSGISTPTVYPAQLTAIRLAQNQGVIAIRTLADASVKPTLKV